LGQSTADVQASAVSHRRPRSPRRTPTGPSRTSMTQPKIAEPQATGYQGAPIELARLGRSASRATRQVGGRRWRPRWRPVAVARLFTAGRLCLSRRISVMAIYSSRAGTGLALVSSKTSSAGSAECTTKQLRFAHSAPQTVQTGQARHLCSRAQVLKGRERGNPWGDAVTRATAARRRVGGLRPRPRRGRRRRAWRGCSTRAR